MSTLSNTGGGLPPTSSGAPLLELEHVKASYGDLEALFDVTLSVNTGEIVTLIGANGAGKTTILRVISGIKHATAGALRFAGHDVSGVPAHEMVARGVSHVPEGRQVFPFLTVRENLSLGAYSRRARRDMRRSLEEQLTLFPRLSERMGQLAGTLSGGEQQMLAIARGLMARPKLLLLDEPSLGLAPKVVDEVFDRIQGIRKTGITMLLVEQNVVSGLTIADRSYVVENGTVVLEGTAKSMLTSEVVKAAYLGL
ncbi:MAG TPA: ABC transporter ATP-binding protein [Candidatus Angelobacter sp.]|nr:ABC transporter ATP-binding protein [Candidatus Angelobacter sp.]